jgi:hypothetical protein
MEAESMQREVDTSKAQAFVNRMRNGVFRHHSVSFTKFAFQACSCNHSDISPFRINGLRQPNH